MIPSNVSRVVALASILGLSSFVEARDWHVLPSGVGEKSGASWDQAADAAQIQKLADQLQPGDRLLLGSGEYKNLSISIKASGAPGKPITIQGQDRGSGLPVLSSTWDIARRDKGLTAISIQPGSTHGVLQDLIIRNYQLGVHTSSRPVDKPRAGWRIENVDMDHIRVGYYLGGFSDLKIVNSDLKWYSKHGFRLDAACEGVVFENCTANCSDADRAWEEQTELLPIGFIVNDGGQPNRNVQFIGCVSRNNMMPLQQGRYKNGDGFVVEGNSEGVSFKGCFSIRNQDGGYDLKVKDVRLEDCVAIGNKRDYRVWTTGTLVNCFSGWSVEGIWTKGGPVIVERSTFAGWKHNAITVEDKAIGVELRNCLIAPDGGRVVNVEGAKGVKLVESVQAADLAAAGLARQPEAWNGKSVDLNSTKHSTLGFRAR